MREHDCLLQRACKVHTHGKGTAICVMQKKKKLKLKPRQPADVLDTSVSW